MPTTVDARVLEGLQGCFSVRIPFHSDRRGDFAELFRSDWLPEVFSGPFQLNVSSSRAGVVRGLHYHANQYDFWMLLEGRLRVVLVDLRSGSPSWLRTAVLTSEAIDGERGEGRALLIPPGVAHGYAALSDSRLLYLVSNLYDDGSDEFGVAWDDPSISADWGLEGRPVLSERDSTNPKVSEVQEAMLVPYEEPAWWESFASG